MKLKKETADKKAKMHNPIMVRKDSHRPSVRETVFWIMRFLSMCVCVFARVCGCARFLSVKIQAIEYGRIFIFPPHSTECS